MTPKQIAIAAACLIITIFTITLASATITEDLLSEQATHIEITISQNYSHLAFSLNTSGFEWNEQDIEYEDLLIENIPISTILGEIDFRAEYNDGETYPTLTYFHIKENSLTSFIIDNILTYLDYDMYSEDINNNISLAQEVLPSLFVEPPLVQGNYYIEKQGINYEVGYDRGYGNIPEEYDEQITEIIETAFYTINPKDYLPFKIPYLDLDLDFDASVDLSDIKFENENYDIIVSVGDTEKTIGLTLEGIDFREVTYIPENQEVLETIESIMGLKAGTSLYVNVMNNVAQSIPSSFKPLKFLNITANQATPGIITFKVLQSEVTDKDKVSLYVWEGSWTKLPTTFLSSTATEHIYEATTPHFSIFMIAEDITTTPPPSSDDGSSGSSGSSPSDDYDEPHTNEVLPEPEKPKPKKKIGLGDADETKDDSGFSLATLIVALVLGSLIIFALILFIISKRNKEEKEEVVVDDGVDVQNKEEHEENEI